MKRIWLWLALIILTGCSVSPTPFIPTPTRLTLAPPSFTPPALTATRIEKSSPTASEPVGMTATSAPPPTGAPTATRPAVVQPTPALTPLSIITFTFAPALIDPGGTVTLTWDVRGAEQVVINRILDYRLTLPTYAVPLTGSLVLTTYASERNFASFALFAITGDQTAQAGVTIPIRCPDTWFFADPPPDCPYAAVTTNFVAQDFEQGRMIWAESSDRIYILYAGGARWSPRQNAWFAGLPESDPTLIPPAGYYQPVRGFGLVWRDEQSPAGARVRDQLGWATNQEYEWGAGAVQCTAVTKYSTCYLGGPEGMIYRLRPEGSGWEVWHGPAP